MHRTAMENCERFATTYDIGGERWTGGTARVLDVGSMDVNGSVKDIFIKRGCKYVGLDIAAGDNVDVVLDRPGAPFPFKKNSFDVIVSTSCLEHDPAFWVTVKEMMRVSKTWIYLNAPSAQQYHPYPIDCWRFLKDSMQALASLSDDWELVESYVDERKPWQDCVGVFRCNS